MALPPTVLSPLHLPALLNHILSTQSSSSPTHLIICSARDAFLQELLDALRPRSEQDGEGLQNLIIPTLHNLSTARHVKVTFCASVQALLAWLAAYDGPGGDTTKQPVVSGGRTTEMIVLVNPLRLHATAPTYSAQGLSRTFAAAVETATRVGSSLVVAECEKGREDVHARDEGEDEAMGEAEEESRDGPGQDPWEQEVSILNVSAKKFGSANSDRAWAGRTVKVKRVAARWFRFLELDTFYQRERPG